MRWVELFPKDTFKDDELEVTNNILTPVSAFGISVRRKGSHLRLFMGAPDTEIHHITSVNDIESTGVEPEVAVSGKMKSLKLRKPSINPLCTEPQPCLLYTQARSFRDFTFAMIGLRVSANAIRKPAKSFLDKASAKSKLGGSRNEITEPVKWKYEQQAFFCTTILFECAKEMQTALLSSINFTNKLLEPNALVPGSLKDGSSAAIKPPRHPTFGKRSYPILTITEISSILPLPPSMWGVEMKTGAEKTFSNLEGSGPDPAVFIRDGVVSDEGAPEPEHWDEGIPDPADFFKKK